MPLSQVAVGAVLQRLLLPSGDEIPEHRRGWNVTDGGRSVPLDGAAFEQLPEIATFSMFNALLRALLLPGSATRAQKLGYGLCSCGTCGYEIIMRYRADLSVADVYAAIQAAEDGGIPDAV